MHMPATSPDTLTAAGLLEIDLPGKSAELVKGRLVVREPPGVWHGKVAAKLTYLMGAFVYANDLGVLCAQDTGFQIEADPDTVRAPDLAFVAAARMHIVQPTGYGTAAPDLVVEVASPHDKPGEVLSKVGDWLQAGVRLVWVIDPMRTAAQVHRADGSIALVGLDGALDGEDVLAGFSVRLSDVLK